MNIFLRGVVAQHSLDSAAKLVCNTFSFLPAYDAFVNALEKLSLDIHVFWAIFSKNVFDFCMPSHLAILSLSVLRLVSLDMYD